MKRKKKRTMFKPNDDDQSSKTSAVHGLCDAYHTLRQERHGVHRIVKLRREGERKTEEMMS